MAIRDGFEIRRAAVERRIPCLTSLDTAAALVESLNLLALDGAFEVMTVDEYLRGPGRRRTAAGDDAAEIPLDVPEDREEAMLCARQMTTPPLSPCWSAAWSASARR